MPIRTLLFLSLLLAFAAPLAADDAPPAGLLEWGKQLLRYCPDETFRLDRASVPSPDGFSAWTLSQRSSWAPCGQRMTIYASGTQAIAGRAFPLASDARPLEERVAERARPLLDRNATVFLGKEKLPDGLRRVRMDFATAAGAMPVGAFLDRSESNLVIGVRGSLAADPGAEVVDLLSQGGVTRGKRGAKIVILEISDLQCPGCAEIHATLEPFIRKHLDDVEYRRVDLPIFEEHDWTLTAAAGAQAIQKLAPAVYWEYVDYIFQRQTDLNAATIGTAIRDFAEGHDLDWKAVEREVNSPAVRRTLVARVGSAFTHGIFSTPTIFVNGRVIADTGSGIQVIAYLQELLKK